MTALNDQPEEPVDRGFYERARSWLSMARAEPCNSLLSDRGVASLVVARALMQISRLEDECSRLQASLAENSRISDVRS
jgi:hypothetical protein